MARLSLIAAIATRHLLARRRRVVVTTALAAAAIALALAAVATTSGLRATFTERLLEVGAHLTVTAGDARGRRSDLLLDVGAATGAVELGRTGERVDRIRIRNVLTVVRSLERTLADRLRPASPYLAADVLATYGTNEELLPIRGIIPEREDGLSHVSRALVSGSLERLAATRFGLLLGARAARELGAGIGDRIRVVSMTGDIFNAEVVGVFDLGVESLDRLGLVNLRFAQAIEHALPSEATAISLQLASPADASSIASRIERGTGRDVETWEETNAAALSSFRDLRVYLYAIAGGLVTLAMLAIAHAVAATGADDREETGTLASLGLGSSGAALVHAWQGALLAIGACVAGAVLGAIVMAIVATIPSERVSALLLIERARIPMRWAPLAFAVVFAATVLGSVLCALVLSRGAARSGMRALLSEAT